MRLCSKYLHLQKKLVAAAREFAGNWAMREPTGLFCHLCGVGDVAACCSHLSIPRSFPRLSKGEGGTNEFVASTLTVLGLASL